MASKIAPATAGETSKPVVSSMNIAPRIVAKLPIPKARVRSKGSRSGPPAKPTTKRTMKTAITKAVESSTGGAADNPTNPDLDGFTFEIQNAYGVLVDTVTTDAGGEALSKAFGIGGSYVITETDSQGLTDVTGSFTIDLLTTGLNEVAWINRQPALPVPAIEIEKATNGVDADDAADAPEVAVGEAVVWTYLVTNTGDVALDDITIIDDNGTPGDATDDIVVALAISLAPGASDSFDALGVATEGLYRNEATVTSAQGAGDRDPSHYLGILEPEVEPIAILVFGVDIELATDGVDADLAQKAVAVGVGNDLIWRYLITTTTDNPLTNIVVVDNNGTPVDFSDDVIVASGFDPAGGESIGFTRTGVGIVGLFGNLANVTATEGVSDLDPAQSQGSPILMPNTGSGGLLDPANLPDASATRTAPLAPRTDEAPNLQGPAAGSTGSAGNWLLGLLAAAGLVATAAMLKQRRS